MNEEKALAMIKTVDTQGNNTIQLLEFEKLMLPEM